MACVSGLPGPTACVVGPPDTSSRRRRATELCSGCGWAHERLQPTVWGHRAPSQGVADRLGCGRLHQASCTHDGCSRVLRCPSQVSLGSQRPKMHVVVPLRRVASHGGHPGLVAETPIKEAPLWVMLIPPGDTSHVGTMTRDASHPGTLARPL